jgi:hypothetical protein
MRRTRKAKQARQMTRTDRILKWIGVGTLLFGVLPVVAVTAGDIPGIIREIKIEMMGQKGGWKQAH